MTMNNETAMTLLTAIASYDNGAMVDTVVMTAEALEDWVCFGYAYDEYDSILVDGVEASDLFAA